MGLTVFISNTDASAQDFFVPVSKAATAYSKDSIVSFLVDQGFDTSNLFITNEKDRTAVLGKLHKLNKLLLFDESGSEIVLHPEMACPSYTKLIENLPLSQIDRNSQIEDYTSLLDRVTIGTMMRGQITAIVFWSFSSGLPADDNPLVWDRKLRARFHNQVNIMHVNLDVSSSWSETGKLKNLTSLQKILNYQNASLQ